MTPFDNRKNRDQMPEEDELFQPTLQSNPAERRVLADEPWRVKSQLWIAIFGGALSLTTIAYLNSKRLGANVADQRKVLVAGVAGILVTLAAAYLLRDTSYGGTLRGGSDGLGFRLVGRVIAVITSLVIARFLRSAERVYLVADGEYASLWAPGLIAVMVLGILQNLIVTWLLGL